MTEDASTAYYIRVITFISRRLFLISTTSLVLFIAFTAFSFAQQPVRTSQPTTPRTINPTQNDTSSGSVAERVAERKAAIQKQREENKADLTEKLTIIKTAAKSTALQKIDTSVENLNGSKTDKWALVLDTLSSVLERIKVKVESSEAEGADVSAVSQLVDSAQAAIEEASSTVETQAEKTYTFEITDEKTLRSTVQPVIQTFKQDLTNTLASVRNARDSVREAAKGLSQISTPAGSQKATDSAIIEQ